MNKRTIDVQNAFYNFIRTDSIFTNYLLAGKRKFINNFEEKT